MSLKRLGPRDRRALLLGAAAVTLPWLALRVLPQVLAARERLYAETEAAVLSLGSAQQALAQASWVQDSLGARAERLVAWAPRLISGVTPAEATAELQGVISLLARQHRVRLSRVQPVPDSAGGAFTRVALRIEAQADVGGFTHWLAALEEGERLLSVMRVGISAPEPGAPASQPEALRADLVIAGWMVAPRQKEE